MSPHGKNTRRSPSARARREQHNLGGTDCPHCGAWGSVLPVQIQTATVNACRRCNHIIKDDYPGEWQGFDIKGVWVDEAQQLSVEIKSVWVDKGQQQKEGE